nr:protein FAR1-RELATED SEQUENCE 5-like [Lolium perenne]
MVKQLGRRRYYRSHRKVPEEDFQLLQTLHNQNISTAQIMGCLGNVRGGDLRTLGYVKRDVSNIRTMLRNDVSLRDMSLTIEYFEKRKAESPSFFYATQLDENNAVRALFWVDGRTRSLYPKYKECVFFDTTFCTNRYNMPFAPIVGINNHTHTIVLGCALLPDETFETFKWVFERWMMAMNQVAPDHIMTDQDQQIGNAISKVFPHSIHRCCFYHVVNLARRKLGPKLVDGHPFADAFYSCIYGTDSPEQFEYCWKHMLQVHSMSENKHLQNMWDSRKKWAPVYFRHRFFPFTSTTGRSEGLNSYFKKLVRPSESVWNFVQQYELCQNLMLDREDNAGFTMETTGRPLWGSCGCNTFEMCGLLCAHIIRVMVHLNVQEIPARKMNNLASDACYAEDTYAIVSSMVDEAGKIVTNMRRARNGMQQQPKDMQPEQHEAGHQGNEAQQKASVDEAQGSGNLRNPPRNKPKGRPKETEKRHKPLTELREEANKKRQKKASEPKTKKEPAMKRKARVKKCPYCNKEGHAIQECTWMKLARQADEARAAGVELRL